MNGTITGLYQGQHDRVDELNSRLRTRQFPDTPLPPNFSRHPVMTRYSRFPIADRVAPSQEPIRSVPMHSVENNFNPGSRAPPTTFFQSIDVESGLRNQTVAKQKAEQAVYVPSSNSDLYRVTVPMNAANFQPQPHPGLFIPTDTHTTSREERVRSIPIGRDLFNNHTRTQLRSFE